MRGCTALKEVYIKCIGEICKLRSLESYCFAQCSALKYINLTGHPVSPRIDTDAFIGCDNLIVLSDNDNVIRFCGRRIECQRYHNEAKMKQFYKYLHLEN